VGTIKEAPRPALANAIRDANGKIHYSGIIGPEAVDKGRQ